MDNKKNYSTEYSIDIIMPVYNAMDELKSCLASLYKYTDFTVNRLIIINDNSSDYRIKIFLDEQEQIAREKALNLVVVHNSTNKGFSANVNLGIGMSEDKDVILLNSDTIVTARWVEKICNCAYSDTEIGTVTPLSNNATLCSVPRMFEENKLDSNMSVDEVAAIVERVSLRRYPRISVANGFCMMIKRSVIESIGLFDEEAFGRGYGEENDFCNRASQMGFWHVMCDDTYIYHAGTKSFIGAEKYALIKEHDKLLRSRYPQQMLENDKYVRDNPNSDIGENLKIYFALFNGKKNILYAIHSDFREDASDCIGGTQFHVKHLKDCLCDEYNIFVAAVNNRILNLTVYIGSETYTYRYEYYYNENYFEFFNKRLRMHWQNILNGFHIDIVHIHHSIKQSLDLFYVASENRIPVFCTLHDYFYICPSEKLLDMDGKVCFGKEVSDEKCRKCLQSNKGISDRLDYLSKWRKECRKALAHCTMIFAPSKVARDIYVSYYPELADSIMVIEHGYDRYMVDREESGQGVDYKTNYIFENESMIRRKKLNIAFIGGINDSKGGKEIVEIVKGDKVSVYWYVFGGIGTESLDELTQKNLIKKGRYSPEELPQLVKEYEIDIIAILSTWPETYSYTLTEAYICNVPVIVTDIGALGDRVDELECGWKVSVENCAEEFKQIINKLSENRQMLTDIKDNIKADAVYSLKDMADKYSRVYEESISKNGVDHSEEINELVDYEYLFSGNILSKYNGNNSGFSKISLTEYNNAITENERIKNSISFRLSKKIISAKIPGKYFLYSLIKKILK